MSSRHKIIIMLFGASLLGACSTAADHADVLASFADSTDQAAAAIQAYDTSAADRMTEIMTEKSIQRGVVVRPAPGECLSTSQGCHLYLYDSPTSPGEPIDYTTLMPNIVSLAQVTANYAKALSNLASADSSAQVKQALDKVSASAEAIAGIVYPESGAAAKAVLDPLNALLAYVYTQGQEIAKMDALKKATTTMDPMMQDMAKLFTDVTWLAKNDQEGERQKAVANARLNFETDRSADNLDAWRTASRLLDADLIAPQDQVFDSMAKAHHALTLALQDNIHSFKDAEAAIQRLATQAQAVYKLAKGFQKPSASTSN